MSSDGAQRIAHWTANSCEQRRIDFLSSFVIRLPAVALAKADHFHCFRLRKLKKRGYFKTRVQLDHARQRERGEQRAGRD